MSDKPAQPAQEALDPVHPQSAATQEPPTAVSGRPSAPARGIPGDPTTVTTEQMRAAYDALGLDPERFNSTHSIHIGPDGLKIVRHHMFDGKVRLIPGTDAIYAELLTIHLEGWLDFRNPDVLAEFEEPERLRERAAKLLAKADEVDAEETK